MIQELFGGGNVGILNGGDQRSKFTTPSTNASHSPSPSPSPSSSAAAGGQTTTTALENLRCPRCDSSNTKFCYYNNYNLTQPRHFCKTCRRYWTKGGALRNVPIGGGCRKNRSTAVASAAAKSGSAAKLIRTVSSEMGKSNTGLFGGFDNTASNPIMWASSQNSHFLSLLRANQNPSYNPNLLNSTVKEEGGGLFGSAHFSSDQLNSMNGRALGLDNLGPAQFGSTSTYRNHAAAQGINIHGDLVQGNNGLQDLYQRIRSSASTTSCFPESGQVMLGNVASYSSNGSAILESAPVATGDQFGFWNPSNTLSWPIDNLQASNGAYPA